MFLRQSGPSTGSESSMEGPSKVTLVYFIGGCTHAEISSLRFLARQENSKYFQFCGEDTVKTRAYETLFSQGRLKLFLCIGFLERNQAV